MDFLNKHPMYENNQDEQDILKNTDVNVDESTDTVVEEVNDDQEEDINSLKEELNKFKEDYHNQKIRAEKAEAKLKSGNSTGKGETSKGGDLSAFDLIAVTKANLSEDALKEAMEYAKYKKISVAEAIKAPAVKAMIADIEEKQRTADATNTGQARRGSSKISDDSLLENARRGVLPDSDADLQRLIKLRRANR